MAQLPLITVLNDLSYQKEKADLEKSFKNNGNIKTF